jgi:glycosyltransferase involved in cell wall biosynthesis
MMGLKDSKSRFQKVAGFIRANLFVPDARKGWAPFAAEAAIKRIGKGDIVAFITTGPPHSTHLAGLRVKQATGLPWIADLRDPWVNIYYNKDLPRMAYFRNKDQEYENTVLAKADAVTVVSPGMVNEFGPRAKRIELIYNGYDAEDLPKYATPAPTDAFVLSHIGNFFPSLDSEGLRQALAQLVKEEPGFAENFRLEFTGMTDPFVMERFRAAGLESLCTFNPPVGHKAAVQMMFASSALLFSISRDGDSKVLLSGKLFEYLATGLPILSLGDPEGAAAILLANAAHAPMLEYDDVQGLKVRVLRLYRAWMANGKTATPLPKADIEKYSRRALAGEMGRLLLELTK